MMFDEIATEREISTYRIRLEALAERYAAGARSLVAEQAQECADTLICLLEEAPLGKREKIDYPIDRYEAVRISCLN